MKNGKKIRYLTRKPPTEKNSMIGDISSCVIQRYNVYQVVKIEHKNCLQQDFRPIDIVYDPVETPDKIIECYFTEEIHVAYRLKYSKGVKGIETLHAFECYSCHKFHTTKSNFEKHLVNCAQSESIVYKVDNKSLVSFEDNYQYLGDLPFVVYFDFETTAGDDLFQDKKMYVLSYCIIIAFHPKLDIERIVIYHSFQQNQDQLFDLSHLKDKMLQFVDKVT